MIFKKVVDKHYIKRYNQGVPVDKATLKPLRKGDNTMKDEYGRPEVLYYVDYNFVDTPYGRRNMESKICNTLDEIYQYMVENNVTDGYVGCMEKIQ